MSAKSILRPVVVSDEPVQPVVELLESALAEARAGKIRSVLMAWECDRDATSHGFAWGAHTSVQRLVGETERAKTRLVMRMINEAGDE